VNAASVATKSNNFLWLTVAKFKLIARKELDKNVLNLTMMASILH